MLDAQARRDSLVSRLSVRDLPGPAVADLAAGNVQLLADPVVQDLLYNHPSTDVFVAIEVTLQLTVKYYHDNSGPGDLVRLRDAAPAALRPAIDLAWGYHWVDRWELRRLRREHDRLAPAAAEVFRTLLLDAAAARAVPSRAAALSSWAAALAAASASLSGC